MLRWYYRTSQCLLRVRAGDDAPETRPHAVAVREPEPDAGGRGAGPTQPPGAAGPARPAGGHHGGPRPGLLAAGSHYCQVERNGGLITQFV